MKGQPERHHGHRVLQFVAAAAEVVELVDEVEEGEQREKTGEHEHDRGEDLASQVPADRLHARAPRSRKPGRAILMRRQ